jgi:cytochrome P450
VVLYVTVLAGAGNETTGRLIGWTTKLLAEYPEQRRELVEDLSLVPNAIEEVLRLEPPGPFFCRSVTRDVEVHGTTIPAGSVMMAMIAAANRDERRYSDPDDFDIHRTAIQHLTFGGGIHYCLGNALARLEGIVALEEILKRFPTWEVDLTAARLAPTSTVRGWETLPVRTP